MRFLQDIIDRNRNLRGYCHRCLAELPPEIFANPDKGLLVACPACGAEIETSDDPTFCTGCFGAAKR